MRAPNFLDKIGLPPSRAYVVVENQSVTDIMNLIKYKHEKHVRDYDKIAGYFWAGNNYDTARGLFDWCKQNIRYKVESEEMQTVSSPQKILIKRHGDCKHYASFIAGVLDALTRQGHKIDWYYRFASYNPFDDSPGHVFVIIKQGKGDEIWIDPVLDEFDRHKSYTYAIDKKVKSAAMNGIGLLHTRKGHEFNHGRASMGLSAMSARDCVRTNEERMGSVQSTGQAIMKVSPALAVVPVVGWIAAGAGEVVGGLLSIFGKSTSLSSGVDKLIERYQYLVLGQNVTSYHNVNENYKSAAQNWFSVVLGVPVYDVYRFYALADLDPNTLLPLNNSYAQRAANYFKSAPETVGVVTTDQAIAAAQIAATMPIIVGGREVPPGSWSNRTAAPSLVTSATGSSTSTGLSAGLASFLPAGVPMWVIIGAGVTILYFILNQPKTRAKKH